MAWRPNGRPAEPRAGGTVERRGADGWRAVHFVRVAGSRDQGCILNAFAVSQPFAHVLKANYSRLHRVFLAGSSNSYYLLHLVLLYQDGREAAERASDV